MSAWSLKPVYWRARRHVLHLAYCVLRPRTVRMPGGRVMYLDRADGRSFSLWERAGNVNRGSMALWRLLLAQHPWSVILDVGANHGEMLLFPDLPPSAQAYAFEPNPALAPLLRRSLAESRVRAEVVESAVGKEDGRITLHIDTVWSGKSGLYAENTSGAYRSVEVPITRLDTFLAGRGAQGDLLVKIDVEGLEWEVLQGLMPALGRFGRVAIMAEMHRLAPEAFAAIIERFELSELDGGRLVPRPGMGQAQLADMDVVLTPRPTGQSLDRPIPA